MGFVLTLLTALIFVLSDIHVHKFVECTIKLGQLVFHEAICVVFTEDCILCDKSWGAGNEAR